MTKSSSQSKKRSGASSKRKRPERLIYFVDRSLECHTVVNALVHAGAPVEVHSNHFDPDTHDEDWLLQVGRQRWIVLTRDKRIRRRPIEKQALQSAGVRAFVLTSGNLSGDEMAEILVNNLRKIERLARKKDPPFIASVTRSDVTLLPL